MNDALQRALQDARDGRLPAALASVRLLVQRKPGDAEALQVLGLLLVQAGQAAQAIHHLQRAVQVTGGSAGARNNLANALAASGRHEDAVAQGRTQRVVGGNMLPGWRSLSRTDRPGGASSLESRPHASL